MRIKDIKMLWKKELCKNGDFSESLKKIVESEEIRHASDYDDFYIATREEAIRQQRVLCKEYVQAR